MAAASAVLRITSSRSPPPTNVKMVFIKSYCFWLLAFDSNGAVTPGSDVKIATPHLVDYNPDISSGGLAIMNFLKAL